MSESRKYLLPRISVDRPVSVVMLLVAALVVGYIAYSRIPLNLIPEGIESDRLFIWVSYPNATPIEVERKVTLPIEEALATVSRVKQIQASSDRGGASVTIEFLPGTDMDQVYAEVRDRLDRVRPELPEAVEQVRARHWDANDSPIMWMGVTFDTGIIDPIFLMENYVQPALQRLDGVGQVEVWGDGRPEVLIEIDEDRVRGHGIDLFTVVRNLRSQNFALSGGQVREGGRRLMVRSAGRFESVDQIRETVVDAQHNLRLADIAKIELGRVRSSWTHHVNGNQSLGIGIWRTSGANLVQVTRQVHETLDRVLARPELQGIDVEVFWDQGKHVRESVDNLKTSGLWGGLFAALVLLFFLRALRMTLIITLAIPLSILVTVTALYFVGWSLNLATMMGLMLSLGLVVDNAIVIVENIYRKRQSGANPRNASVEGTGEVSLAVTMATLTTVVVFLPLMLMSDDERFSFWMIRIGMPVIVGLVASLIIAMIFIPVAAQRLPVQEGKADSRFLAWLQERYLRSLKWVLHHRLDTLIVMLLAMASIQLPLAGMKKTDEGQGNSRRLRLEVEMPTGQTQSQADRFVATVEDTLINHIYEYHVKAVRTWYRTGHATFELLFKEEESLDWYRVALDNLAIRFGFKEKEFLTYKEISADIKKRLPLEPGMILRIDREEAGQEASVNLNLYGENTETLVGLASEVERRLADVPGFLSVQTDIERGSQEVQIRLDYDQIRLHGLDPRAISGSIAYRMEGTVVSTFQAAEEGRELNIRMWAEEGDRESIEQLRKLTFTTAADGEIPLEALGTFYVSRTLNNIRRENRQTVLRITATADKDDAKSLFEQMDSAMDGFELPRGYRWDKGARYLRMEETDRSQKFAVIMAVIFVFLLMGVLFESFVLPLSVIVAIPFSFLGVFWTLYLTDTNYEFLAVIGTVILIGVVVNNAIVLIDLANRLRADGVTRFDALLEAGRHRFRPILMTTFTTVCGLIPMAAGNAKMIGMPYAPLGRTMIGGLLASTVLTLVIVPLCYTFFDDLRILARRVAITASASPPASAAVDEPAG